jgi:GTP cyclohydrolase II
LLEIQSAGRGVVLYVWTDLLGSQHLHRASASPEPFDERELGIGSQILRDLNLTTLRLLTNNSVHYPALKGYGLQVVDRVPLVIDGGILHKNDLGEGNQRRGK